MIPPTVNDRVAPDMIHSTALIDVESAFAYDDSDFSLIVQSLGELLVWIDVLTRCNDTSTPFREDHRMCCWVLSVGFQRLHREPMPYVGRPCRSHHIHSC